jgi:hypothetical protein
LWLTPAIVIPLCVGLAAINSLVRPNGPVSNWWTSRAGIVTVCAVTIVAVAVFCALVALFIVS